VLTVAEKSSEAESTIKPSD